MHPAIAVTHYCERTGDSFWAEPLNALTSAAFIVAAVLVMPRLARADLGPRPDVRLLAMVAVAIGVGSFLWHTLATPVFMWADVIPISLFIGIYLISFLWRISGLSWPVIVAVFVLFLLVNGVALVALPSHLLNGSVMYLPALVTLLLMAGWCGFSNNRQFRWLLPMGIVFIVSFSLRTLDTMACSILPIGTHFAWHLLNASVIYMAMRSLMD